MKNNKVEHILNSIFFIPMILNGNQDIFKYLELSDLEISELEKLKPFLEYNFQFIREGRGDYDKLRSGLNAYFELYLKDIWSNLDIVNQEGKKLLDFGAGDGSYSIQFELCNPKSQAYQLERESGMRIDFEKNPKWYLPYEEIFDYVLLSEILHCKNEIGQKYIVETSQKILKKGGQVIINENDDIFMGYRLRRMDHGDRMTVENVYDLFRGKFRFINQIKIHNHNIFVYEKV